jgi:hypothetical protein
MKLGRFFLLALFPFQAHAIDLLPIGQVDASGGYSSLVGEKSSAVGLGSLLAIPVLKLDDANFIIPTVFINFSGQGNVIEENSFFVQSALGVFQGIYSHRLDAGLAAKFKLEAKHALNRESFKENWFHGTYDYEEYAAGLGLDSKQLPLLKSGSIGLDLLNQAYPNFHELGAVDTENKNYYTKDFQGLKLGLQGNAALPRGLSMDLSYNLLFKAYTDSYLTQANGSLNLTSKRQDFFETLDLLLQDPLTSHWLLGLDINGVSNLSNQNYFDSDYNQYMAHYYDFASAAFKPQATYEFQGNPQGHSLHVYYQALLRQYMGRLIRNPDGSYAQGLQADVEHSFGADGVYVLNRSWSLVGGLNWQFVRSNQLYEQSLKENFGLFAANLGLEYKL